jgi:hypothetical protein
MKDGMGGSYPLRISHKAISAATTTTTKKAIATAINTAWIANKMATAK